MAESIRTFIAIPLPEAVRGALGRLQEALRPGGPAARWVKPAGIHLTLRFIGDIHQETVAPVTRAVAAAAAGCGPIVLRAQGTGVFPGVSRARVLWAGLGGEVQALGGLYRRLEAGLAAAGLTPEARRFRAHLTLARFKGPADPAQVADLLKRSGDFAAEPFSAAALVLYRSRLEPAGAVYTRIYEAPLAGPGTGPDPAGGDRR